MQDLTPDRTTPLYLKERQDDDWPTDPPVFYLLTRRGLFLCRNHPFFRSSVPVEKGPADLAPHESFLTLSYPKIPCRLLEMAVGFFDRIARLHSAEAAVVLVWDTQAKRMGLVVPPHVSLVRKSWYDDRYRLDVKYELPPLDGHLQAIGDIHCHVDGDAYSSYVDKHDETYRPGIHVVVGRIYQEPPRFHIQAVVDGMRFDVAPSLILDGYKRRRKSVPDDWIAKVRIDLDDPYSRPTWQRTTDRRGNSTGYRTRPWNQERECDDPSDGNGRYNSSKRRQAKDPNGRRETRPRDPLPDDDTPGPSDAAGDEAGPQDDP